MDYYIEYSDGVRKKLSFQQYYVLSVLLPRYYFFTGIVDFALAYIVYVDYPSVYANLSSNS